MYQNKAPHSSPESRNAATPVADIKLDWATDSYTCPGKVFLLGEYAVLGGAGALVASVGPRFHLQAKAVPGFDAIEAASDGTEEAGFHPQSPAARLLDWSRNMGLPDFRFRFADPHAGVGGFGASTAQFVLVYRALAAAGHWPLEWNRVWHLYRELTGTSRVSGPRPDAHDKTGYPPSGADLIAQWHGGIVHVQPDFAGVQSLAGVFDWSRVLVFSAAAQAGRKVATHEHLARLERAGGGDLSKGESPLFAELRTILDRGIEAARNRKVAEFGQAMNDYALALSRAGLEHPATAADRAALGECPGVVGVKGAGAMQADAVLVLMEPDFSKQGAKRRAVIDAACARELALIADGLEVQAGVACLN